MARLVRSATVFTPASPAIALRCGFRITSNGSSWGSVIPEPGCLVTGCPWRSNPTAPGSPCAPRHIGGNAVFNRQDDPYSYEAEGDSYFDQERNRLIGDRHLVLFEDGDELTVAAGTETLRLLLISGNPIGEAIAWRGPIVMNTQEELREAFEELDRGTFIKHR